MSRVEAVPRLFQALVAPAIFVSAAALLLLSLNVRLMGMVSRLRQFQRDKHIATTSGRLQEAQAYADQISSIESRAEKIRKAFLFTLLSLASTICACLLLGLAVYWGNAGILAAFVFVAAVVFLLLGTVFYIAEITAALTSVREEAKYFHLIDLTAPQQGGRPGSDRREGWDR